MASGPVGESAIDQVVPKSTDTYFLRLIFGFGSSFSPYTTPIEADL